MGSSPETRAPLARRLNPPLAHSTPVLRSQLLARAERYEGLSERITSLRTALKQFTAPASLSSSALGLGTLSLGSRLTTAPLEASSNALGSAVPGTPTSGSNPGSAGGTAPASGGTSSTTTTRTVLHSATMLSSEAIALAPGTAGTEGKPATHATLVTGTVALSPSAVSTAELRGAKIQLDKDKDKDGITRFGSVAINGTKITFDAFNGPSAEDAATFLAARINEFQDKTGVVASVDKDDRERLVLTATVAGSDGRIKIDDVNKASTDKGSIGFQKNDYDRGSESATDLGEVTINGTRTRFGTKTFTSTQEALAFMATRLNEDHAGKLEAAIQGERLVLTSLSAGSGSVIRVDAVERGTDRKQSNDGSNGFTAGILARGSDSEPGEPGDPGFTDFGRITINGIETVFGKVDNRDHDATTAARFLAERINETNATVRATVEDGRLLLTSTEKGSDAAIRIDAIVSDSDGNRDNDRDLGFVAGAQASGQETTETTTTSTSSSAAQGSMAPAASGGGPSGSTSSEETPRLTAEESAELSAQTREWTRLTNEYLSALGGRSQEHSKGEMRAFGRTIETMLQQDEGLAAVGIKVEKGRLALDEAAFNQALESDPQAALDAMQQFRETLDPLLASQAHAMDFMRGVAEASRDRAPEISQAKTMIFKLEQRSKDVSEWLSALEKLMPEVSEQSDRLRKLGAPDEEAEDKDEITPEDEKKQPAAGVLAKASASPDSALGWTPWEQKEDRP
jgi:hypothetical protein